MQRRVSHAAFAMAALSTTAHHPLSAAIAKNRMVNAYSGPKRRRVLEVKVLSRLFIYVLYTSDIELASATGRDLWRLYACLTTSLCAMNALQGAK